MAKHLIKRWYPNPDRIREHASIRLFGSLLNAPELWHLNRRSVAAAFFIGPFMTFVPLPTQMLMASLAAIIWRANLPLSVGLVWISNPVTMPAMFYFAYKVGALLLGTEISDIQFELSWEWIQAELVQRWQPFLLGCLVCGLVSGLAANAAIRTLWRYYTIKRWRRRQSDRKAAKDNCCK